ncbi:cell wall-associated NlpC family hydrolase [Humibacillus xanthopallidus]|uniref:Cell wall-associated NlpC family hydrolase n=1 Tax=Humibacillus xanthopallidus TaxID=412689 RepID=A0A543PN60_9MICO|nr:C40 family peptidase [Humibacillus xanthopallidus]TQN45521.1 cell wall-associated NlpC family hydrolase [Humibacillus xanthopallidus]
MAQNVPGRHRAPGRFSAMSELKTIAKESAQPAVKGAAIVAASGGLVASFAGTANAAEGSGPAVAADAATTTTAPAVVGPQAGSVQAPSALSSIGFVAKPASKTTTVKPLVIKDVQVETQRKEAKAKAAEDRAAARQAAANRTSTSASRSTTRTALPDPAPSASGIVGIAKSMFGVPYVYGGTTPSGFDCSGLTSYVYRQAGISIPRTASAQKAAATPVSSPRPGDLVFFGYPVYHVGIYVSPGTMIDAQRPGTTIGYHSIWTTPSGYGRF